MNFRLYKKFLSHSFQEFLIYRSTAIVTIVFGLIFFLAEFIAGVIYFDYTETIYGWIKNDYLLLISVASVISYGYQFLFTVAHENLYEFIYEHRHIKPPAGMAHGLGIIPHKPFSESRRTTVRNPNLAALQLWAPGCGRSCPAAYWLPINTNGPTRLSENQSAPNPCRR